VVEAVKRRQRIYLTNIILKTLYEIGSEGLKIEVRHAIREGISDIRTIRITIPRIRRPDTEPVYEITHGIMRWEGQSSGERLNIVYVVITKIVATGLWRKDRHRKYIREVIDAAIRLITEIGRNSMRLTSTIETNRKILNKIVEQRGHETLKIQRRQRTKTSMSGVIVIEGIQKGTIVAVEPRCITAAGPEIPEVAVEEHAITNEGTKFIEGRTMRQRPTKSETVNRGN